jgi:signal transduction histidine kinase
MTGTTPNASENVISDQDINNLRHGLHLLKAQVQAGQVDGGFILRQIDKINETITRFDVERKTHRKEVRFEALYNVSRLLGSSLDLQTVLDQVMDAIIQLTGAERGFLMLRDDDGGLAVKAARNFDQQTLTTDKFAFSRTIANQVLDSGTHIVTMNAAEDPRFQDNASIVTQSLRSIMATPLWARGVIIGVVYVDNRLTVGLFGDMDIAALDALAGQAAIAIDNARLFGATDQLLQEHVEELKQFQRIDRQLNETLNIDKAMHYTLQWACTLSGATSGRLGLIESGSLRVRCKYHYGLDSDPTEYLESVHPEVLDVAYSGQSLMLRGEQSVLIVPVRRETRVIGVVALERDGAVPFTPYQLDIVERIITRAGVAIENARLYAAVQAADLAKSEFVGIVAHDLKVPMTSIMGYADLTRLDDNLLPRQREFLDKIIDTVRRMENLVSDLADISRIESGHFFMTETRVSVPHIVQALKDNTLTQIEARGHVFVEDIASNLPEMWVDYFRLLQVLTNLVSNAYKYTPNGGTITLSARAVNGRIEFSVSDTGIGLSEDQLAKLGGKFWRADDRFTRSQPGTGLGFSITRSLVEQMGDHVRVKSEVGKGSTFSFSIAVADA